MYQAFIAALSGMECDRLVLDVLFAGRESLDYAKHLSGRGSNPRPDSPIGAGVSNQCVCNICREWEMMTKTSVVEKDHA